MNKFIKILLPLLTISLLSGCNDNLSKLENVLKELSNSKITLRSDYEIYSYAKENKDNTYQILQRFDVVAKFVPDLYEMKAYVYGDDLIASFAHYEKDEEGFIRSGVINENNFVKYSYALDGNGERIPFDDSVYTNQIGKFNVKDFKSQGNEEYYYTGDLTKLPLTLLHAAIPTSEFNIESFKIVLKNGIFDSFVFQEVEDDTVFIETTKETYGRKLTIKAYDIGITEITSITPYADSPDNDPLKNAIKFIKSSRNYTINAYADFENGTSKLLSNVYITENDVIRLDLIPNSNDKFIMGYHTVNNMVFMVNEENGILYGTKMNDGYRIESVIPKFLFSEDIFTYIGEENNVKSYKAQQNMNIILDKVDFMVGYSESYYSPAGDIIFKVKDNKLYEINFPTYITEGNQPVLVNYRLSYSNYDITSIDENTWKTFTTDEPIKPVFDSWDDIVLTFEDKEGNITDKTALEIINEVLKDNADNLPYFMQSTVQIEDGYANYANNNKNIIFGFAIVEYSNNLLGYIKRQLTNIGYECEEIKDNELHLFEYSYDEINISISDFGTGVVLVDISLPLN